MIKEDFNMKKLLEISHLKKSFGDTEVLKDISMEVNEGEVVAILGPSGSGKSTFLRCLNLLEEPTEGQIFFEGTDITDPRTNIKNVVSGVIRFYCFRLLQHHFSIKVLRP